MKTLLKQALDALTKAEDCLSNFDTDYARTTATGCDEAIEALRAAIAQSDEPVAWFDVAVNENIAAVVMIGGVEKHKLKSGDKLYSHPAQPYVPLSADAARYKWIRGGDATSSRWPRWSVEYFDGMRGWQPMQHEQMDKAIDAEIEKEKS